MSKQSLIDLRDKVKAGAWNPYAAELPDGIPDICRAYNGSLDASKALHEAVIPDCGWTLVDDGRARIWHKTPPKILIDFQEGANPARAWLIAILNALIAKEDGE